MHTYSFTYVQHLLTRYAEKHINLLHLSMSTKKAATRLLFLITMKLAYIGANFR